MRTATSKTIIYSHTLHHQVHVRDTGAKARLRRWSRGFLVTVSGGDIIKHFAPLYKAENPAQVHSFISNIKS